MPLISDKAHKSKLKDCNINIKTQYIVGNNILERNTDGSHNDDVTKGIRCKKKYFIGDKLIHEENIFDSRIEYTFISKNEEESNFKCPNCGMESKLKDFLDGCPFCRTIYNVDYTEKDMGSKYHYDLVLRSTTYRVLTAVIDVILSLVLSLIFIKLTSRTFNSYDISKIFVYGVILSLILYYFFYILDAYIILGPIRKFKNKENAKQKAFWERTKIDKKTFFNNLNFEARDKYYAKGNVIDYDILDFLEFKEYTKDNTLFVNITADVRVVTYEHGRIKSKYIKDTYIMKHVNDDPLKLKDGANLLKCHNCGSAIDATKGYCDYCHSKTKYLQEWIMVDN